MKKRVLSFLLALIMCLSLSLSMNTAPVLADVENATIPGQTFSPWATYDLVVGDTYGIYPQSWYQLDMTAPISRSQLKVLISGVRTKIVYSEEITNNLDTIYKLENNMTVEKVMNAFYSMLNGFEFSKEIGLKDKTATAFMKENGIYTGENGELALKDKCSIEQACVIATRLITVVYDKLDAASKGFLWVTKSGGNTVYMLGSIHMASHDIYPFSSDMLKAFYSADALAVESNMLDINGAKKYDEIGIYSDGTTLKDHVSAETYKKTVEFAKMFGIQEEMISMLKPWYIFLSFAYLTATETGSAEELASDASLGIDINFLTNALISQKPILEVEGPEFQAKQLDSFSDELEEVLLIDVIEDITAILSGTSTEGADTMDQMLEFWKDGDVESFLKVNRIEDEYPVINSVEAAKLKTLMEEYKLKFMTQRDKHMADFIEKLLKSEGNNTYFVVVGSAHYISDYSVLDMLEDKGYDITQIK